MNDWKKRLDIVYSTNPDYHYDKENDNNAETLPVGKQLYVSALTKK